MKKPLILLPVVILGFLACKDECKDPKIDMKEANQLLIPDVAGLQHFNLFAESLVKDSAAIYAEYRKVAPKGIVQPWIATNRFHLNKIDSLKYDSLLLPLKGKMDDNVSLTDRGDVFIMLKTRVQTRCDDYAFAYNHLLVSVQDTSIITKLRSTVQKIYLDSAIGGRWRYLYFMAHTGH